MDNTVRTWDVRPFVVGDSRAGRIYLGAQHNYEKNLLRCSWAGDGSRVACGSADWCVYVWSRDTGKIIYRLPGHKGSVNEVDLHPKQPIVMSGGSDKVVFLGEVAPPASGD